MTKPRFKGKYRVESIRLPHRDYGANGAYFVTICTQNRRHFFGSVVEGQMQLSAIGQVAQRFWAEIPQHFDQVDGDAYVIMPNHVHGIVVIDRSRGGDGLMPQPLTSNDDDIRVSLPRSTHTDGLISRPLTPDDDAMRLLPPRLTPTDGLISQPLTPVETLHCNVSTWRGGYPKNPDGGHPTDPHMTQISPRAGSLGAIVRSYKSAVTRWCRQNGFDDFGWQPRFYEHIIRPDGSLDRIRRYIHNNPAKWSADRDNPAGLRM